MGLVAGMFFVTGTGLNALGRYRNDGKVSVALPRVLSRHFSPSKSLTTSIPHSTQPIRSGIDAFEEQMMDRDERLTGHFRKQSVSETECDGQRLIKQTEAHSTHLTPDKSNSTARVRN